MTALGESTYEAVFDHGNEGYGVWFDGVVREDPVYRQHWKGTGLRPIFVKMEEDRITITRELDRDRPQPETSASDQDVPESNVDSSDNAPIDAGAVYSEEDAAKLFADEATAAAAGSADADGADGSDSDDSGEEDAPAAKPRRRAPARRRSTTADDE
jgi:hypothetical protein